MATLSLVSIALQGLGFGALAVVLHGFVPITTTTPEPEPKRRSTTASGGGRGGGPDAQVSMSDFVRRFVQIDRLPVRPKKPRNRQKNDTEILRIIACY
jgi:hypothetical protein